MNKKNIFNKKINIFQKKDCFREQWKQSFKEIAEFNKELDLKKQKSNQKITVKGCLREEYYSQKNNVLTKNII